MIIGAKRSDPPFIEFADYGFMLSFFLKTFALEGNGLSLLIFLSKTLDLEGNGLSSLIFLSKTFALEGNGLSSLIYLSKTSDLEGNGLSSIFNTGFLIIDYTDMGLYLES